MDIAEITKMLGCGDFDKLLGLEESGQVEAKGAPYQLSTDLHKQELAKDVSALGNASGGIVLIGFESRKDSLSAVERITAIRTFHRTMCDLQQYRDVLQEWILPPIHPVLVQWYPSISDKNKGVVAITVPPETKDGKPYIVKRAVDAGGRVKGTLIGYFERVQDRIPATSPEGLRTWLRDGMRFDDISHRLATIEQFLADLSAIRPPRHIAPDILHPELSVDVVEGRITEAQSAVDRSSEPVIVMTASSGEGAEFPQLFRSRSEPIVQLIDNPPLLRGGGFGIGIRLSRPSEIVKGELRRRLNSGSQIIDLWQDGLLLGIGEGDYDLLCWFTRNTRNPAIQDQSLLIRNFVLAEITLNFIRLGVEVFKHAEPPPKTIRFSLCLDNMTVSGHTCELSSIPDGTRQSFGHNYKPAPGPKITSEFAMSFVDLDMGRIAYELFRQLYVKFGFHESDVPYVQNDNDGKRITAASVNGLLG